MIIQSRQIDLSADSITIFLSWDGMPLSVALEGGSPAIFYLNDPNKDQEFRAMIKWFPAAKDIDMFEPNFLNSLTTHYGITYHFFWR